MAEFKNFCKKYFWMASRFVLFFIGMWSIGVYMQYPSTDTVLLRFKANFMEAMNDKNTNAEYHLPLMNFSDVGISKNWSRSLTLFTKDYLKTLAPDVFKRVPTNYLENYRNPCWMEGGKLLCLPYFYVIGFHKCGTSDVFGRVVKHPNVLRVLKEPHWWSIKRIQMRRKLPKLDVKQTSAFDWYLNVYGNQIFSEIENSTLKINNSNGTWTTFHPKVFGDGSVSTIARVIYTQWKSDEDPESLPYLMHAIQPQAKIIITVRDPVSRFRSMYYRKIRKGLEDLHRFAEQAVQCAMKCLDKSDVRHCAYHPNCNTSPQIYMGIYVAFIKHWASVYGLENMLVLRMEDRFKDPVKEFKRVLQYLELETLPDDQCKRITNGPAINGNRGHKAIMMNDTIMLLRKFYKPFNKELADFMNDGKYLFGY